MSAQLTRYKKVLRQDGTSSGTGTVSTGLTELVVKVGLTLEEASEVATGTLLLTTVVRVSVTGQTVVEMAIVTTVVVTEGVPAGQLVTVGSH
mgnify:CR=1 FL=1